MNVARRNRLTGMLAGGLVAAMIGLAFASVPLYRLFCQVTGFGGTPQQAAEAPTQVLDRTITVRFTSDVSSKLPWRFGPVERKLDLKVGEQKLAFYRAVNDSAAPATGTATFNVTPPKAGAYFAKVDCFCFTEQTLAPGQSIEMPVSFFIDPDIAKDPNLDDVTEITLSYTFYPVRKEARAAVRTQN